jgi:hypothetical protein
MEFAFFHPLSGGSLPNNANNTETLNQYLLGRLKGEERAAIEARYFDDADYYEQLKIAETELIDAYVNQQLPASDREAFEATFLTSPGRQQRVAFARAWREKASRLPLSQDQERQPTLFFNWLKRPLVFAPLAAGLVLAVVGIWLAGQNRNLNNALNQAVAEEVNKIDREIEERQNQQRQEFEQLAQQQAPEQTVSPTENPLAPQLIASIILSPGTVRGSGRMPYIEVHSYTEFIELILPFKAETYKSYSATIDKVAGAQILAKSSLAVRVKGTAKSAVWRMSAKSLPPGDYLLTLRGQGEDGTTEDLAEYQFRILQK